MLFWGLECMSEMCVRDSKMSHLCAIFTIVLRNWLCQECTKTDSRLQSRSFGINIDYPECFIPDIVVIFQKLYKLNNRLYELELNFPWYYYKMMRSLGCEARKVRRCFYVVLGNSRFMVWRGLFKSFFSFYLVNLWPISYSY